jgi:hypothetical protein
VDSVLAYAHTISEQLVCTGCGQPRHEAYNPDSEGWYVVHDATCQGCAAIEKDARIHKDDDTSRKTWVVNERPPEIKLKPWSPNGGV